MHNLVEESIKASLKAVLCAYKVTGNWQPATTTIERHFLGDYAAILCGAKGLQGVIVISIPRGVAMKIAMLSYSNSTESDALQLIGNIASSSASRLKNNDVAFMVKGVIAGYDPQFPAPVPRRITPFVSNHGNLVLETYLRRTTILLSQSKDWWINEFDKTDRRL
jgi:hypothetical protein